MLSVQVGQIYPTKYLGCVQKFRRILWNCLWKYVNYWSSVFNLHINIWLESFVCIFLHSPGSGSYVSTCWAVTTEAALPGSAKPSLACPRSLPEAGCAGARACARHRSITGVLTPCLSELKGFIILGLLSAMLSVTPIAIPKQFYTGIEDFKEAVTEKPANLT